MPYIQEADRMRLSPALSALSEEIRSTPPEKLEGVLTYVFFQLLLLTQRDNPTYADHAATMGVLECTKTEYYRRVVAPYEDSKITQNGDLL